MQHQGQRIYGVLKAPFCWRRVVHPTAFGGQKLKAAVVRSLRAEPWHEGNLETASLARGFHHYGANGSPASLSLSVALSGLRPSLPDFATVVCHLFRPDLGTTGFCDFKVPLKLHVASQVLLLGSLQGFSKGKGFKAPGTCIVYT